jgi:hypothetical protein
LLTTIGIGSVVVDVLTNFSRETHGNKASTPAIKHLLLADCIICSTLSVLELMVMFALVKYEKRL